MIWTRATSKQWICRVNYHVFFSQTPFAVRKSKVYFFFKLFEIFSLKWRTKVELIINACVASVRLIFWLLSRDVRACYNLQPSTYGRVSIRSAKRRLLCNSEVAWPKRGRDLPSSFVPFGRRVSEWQGKRKHDICARRREKVRRRERTSFVCPSDVKPAALFWGAPCFVCFVRAWTGSRLARSPHITMQRSPTCRVFLFSSFKGNDRSLSGDHSVLSGHARSLTPSPAICNFAVSEIAFGVKNDQRLSAETRQIYYF